MSRGFGIQLYAIRDCIGNEAEVRKALKRLVEAGYDCIEMLDLTYEIGDRSINWGSMLKEYGLRASGMHIMHPIIVDNFENTLKTLDDLDCKDIIVAASFITDMTNREQVVKLTDDLNRLGYEYQKRGCRLHYHNHVMEFSKFDPDAPYCSYDYLIQNTDPELVYFELDTYWALLAGGDPYRFFEKIKGRTLCAHMKDAKAAGGTLDAMSHVSPCTELGQGIMDLQSLWQKAEAAGVKDYIMEVNDYWIDNDPLKSAEICADYYHRYLENK